jgi:hypothetical protein
MVKTQRMKKIVNEIAAGIYSDLSSGKYKNKDKINESIKSDLPFC